MLADRSPTLMKPPVFKDKVRIRCTAGNGGNGSALFRREKFIPFGGPSGGDGGNGGSVILVGEKNENSLLDLYFRPLLRAEHGQKGGNSQCTGRRGADLRVKVPCGTVITEEETGEVIGEVLDHGQELIAAQGGKGGLGNIHFQSSSNQAPTEFTEGTEGQDRALILELKIISEVGLVGYPNAGKSTLIGQLTDAHPKTAPYPFTTIHPNIGVLEFEDLTRIRIADIPGLIEGAHEGHGLGHDFLRHIERTHYLIYVIDMSGIDDRDPVEDYRKLRRELKLYNAALLKRPSLIVANKMDMPASAANLKRFRSATRTKPLPAVAELGEGLDAVRAALHDHFFPQPKRSRRA